MLIEGTATFWLDALKIFDALPEWFSKETGSQKSSVVPVFGNIRMTVPNRWANVTHILYLLWVIRSYLGDMRDFGLLCCGIEYKRLYSTQSVRVCWFCPLG